MNRNSGDGDAKSIHDFENDCAIGNHLVHGAIVAVAEKGKNIECYSIAMHVEIGHA